MRMLGAVAMLAAASWAGLAGFVGTGELFSLALDAWDVAMAGAGLAIPSGPGALFSNPAALAGEEGLSLGSTVGNTFGQASRSAVAVKLGWLGLGGVRLDASGDGVPLLHEGAALGLGVQLSPGFSLGARARVLHLVLPEEHTGWSLDLAAQYRGEVMAALVMDALAAAAPTPGEEWPPSLSLGLALPLATGAPLSGWLAIAATGIGGNQATASLGAELWLGELGLRLGVSPEKAALGMSAGWHNFRLNLAVELNAVLSASFVATLIVRFG